jgi:hypothetical protein
MPNSLIARPSVASLFVQSSFNDQLLSTATAFTVEHAGENFLITNWHVVAGRRPDTGQPLSNTAAVPDQLTLLVNVAGRLGSWIEVTLPLYDSAGVPVWFEHPEHGRQVDVVAIPFLADDGLTLYSHDPWSTEPDVAIGPSASVMIVGFPFGMTGGGALGIWVRGSVATEPDMNYGDLPCFLVDSRTRPGQSGSPTIAYYGSGMVPLADGGQAAFAGPVERFFGVYSGRVNDHSDLGFVWKSSAVREIIEGKCRGPAPAVAA